MDLGVCLKFEALIRISVHLPFFCQRAESTSHLTNSLHAPSPSRTRQVRSAPAPPSDRFAHYSQLREHAEAPNSLNQLLARLIPRKGSAFQIRSSLSSRALAPSHRIEDRDYLGWMDFGRRSAEEYEYSP
uniref:Gastrin/cholecystokinin peptide hormone domain-containing protein n=1 Tax=Xiphophorus couchianus TaxID=32473 RepID=A0A3B5MDT3_9TELE